MQITGCRNPRWSDAEQKLIHCEIEINGAAWVPFHATAGDPIPHGRELFARLIKGEVGPIAAYTPPKPDEHASAREGQGPRVVG